MEKNELLKFYIGNKIKYYRYHKGISGASLGQMIGVSQQQISRYENGMNIISFSILNKLFKCLELSELEVTVFFDEIKDFFIMDKS